MTENPYIKFEVLDPQTGRVVGRGEALMSSVLAQIDQGKPIRIIGTIELPEEDARS